MACSLAWVSGSLFGVSARDLFLVRFLSMVVASLLLWSGELYSCLGRLFFGSWGWCSLVGFSRYGLADTGCRGMAG